MVVETDNGTKKALFSQIYDKINDCVESKAEVLNLNSITDCAERFGLSCRKDIEEDSYYCKDNDGSISSSVTVAYIYVPATGRYAYCKYSAIEKYNGYYRLKNYTTLYSKSNLTGTKYNYLAKTKVVIKKTL